MNKYIDYTVSKLIYEVLFMKNNHAFLTLSFGSTYPESRQQDIGGIEQALKDAFPYYYHCRAYTSAIVRRQLAKENIFIDDPATALQKLHDEGFRHILLQPTHLLHGEEFEQKILSLKEKFADAFDSFKISTPLIASDDDYAPAAAAIAAQFPPVAPSEGIILMGHGTPRRNNQAFGRTYVRLQETFDAMGLPVIVGTVEDEDSPNFAAVLQQLQQRRYSCVHMYPLMVVSGDHANNDMYGDEPDSWKNRIERIGITTHGHLYGLGRNKAIQSLYIRHALKALFFNEIK